ncbi:MAG: hypothetical protein AB7K09_20845 [Planctomycetota bacterium]
MPSDHTTRLRKRLEALEISRPIGIAGSLITALLAIGLAIRELAVAPPHTLLTAVAVLLMSLVTLAAIVGLIAWQVWPRRVFAIGAAAGLTVFLATLLHGPAASGQGYAAALLVLANTWSFPAWLSRDYAEFARYRGDIAAVLAVRGNLARPVDAPDDGVEAVEAVDDQAADDLRSGSATAVDVSDET